MKVIVRGSLALLGLLLSVLHSNWAPAYADDFWVQLTATESTKAGDGPERIMAVPETASPILNFGRANEQGPTPTRPSNRNV